MKGGQVFLRCIFNKISMLRHNSHRTFLSAKILQDIEWWYHFIPTFNGKSLLLDKMPLECVCTDACDEAAGGYFGCDRFYYNWSKDWPLAKTFHINEKEVLAVVIAANHWAHLWRNKRVLIYSDSSVTSVNKATARNMTIMKSLRYLFWLSAIFNFHLTACFIPGIYNTVADSASRLLTPGFLEMLLPYTDYSPLHLHMSSHSLAFLLDRFSHWISRTRDRNESSYSDAASAVYPLG